MTFDGGLLPDATPPAVRARCLRLQSRSSIKRHLALYQARGHAHYAAPHLNFRLGKGELIERPLVGQRIRHGVKNVLDGRQKFMLKGAKAGGSLRAGLSSESETRRM